MRFNTPTHRFNFRRCTPFVSKLFPPSISPFSRFARSKGSPLRAFSLTVHFGKRIVSRRVTVMYIYGYSSPLYIILCGACTCYVHLSRSTSACAVRVTVPGEKSRSKWKGAHILVTPSVFTIIIAILARELDLTIVVYTSSFTLKGYPCQWLSS